MRISLIKIEKIILSTFILSLCFLFFNSCGDKKEDQKKQFNGIWIIKKPGVQESFIFSETGVLTIGIKTFSETSTVILKHGNIRCNWAYQEPLLTITPTEIDKKIQNETPYKVNKKIVFNVIEINNEGIKLEGENNQAVLWERSTDSKASNAIINAGEVSINLKSIVVNLYKDRIRGKERFFCIDLTLQLKDANNLKYVHVTPSTETTVEKFEVHPRVRDAAILFLSSKTFKEVKTFVKTKAVNDQLEKILNHYLDGKLKKLIVERIVVTTKTEGIEDFLQKTNKDAELDEISEPEIEDEDEVEES